MGYKVFETDEAIQDVTNIAIYILQNFKSKKAVENFLNIYDEIAQSLDTFPKGYRGINIEYRGYEIRINPFDTYNMFFVVDDEKNEVIILRLLKDRQDWNRILQMEMNYHFSA